MTGLRPKKDLAAAVHYDSAGPRHRGSPPRKIHAGSAERLRVFGDASHFSAGGRSVSRLHAVPANMDRVCSL